MGVCQGIGKDQDLTKVQECSNKIQWYYLYLNQFLSMSLCTLQARSPWKHLFSEIEMLLKFESVNTWYIRNKKGNQNMLSQLKHTCINQTASLSPLEIPLYTAAPRVDIYSGSLVGGEFSLNVSLQLKIYCVCQPPRVIKKHPSPVTTLHVCG